MTPTDEAARAVTDFANGPALVAADETAKLFEAAGERIADALETAARSGELSFNAMAESVARDLARLAVSELISTPLENIIGSIGGQITGAAFGGSSGAQKPPVTVNMNVSGVSDPSAFARSQSQISTSLARAVTAGQRFT